MKVSIINLKLLLFLPLYLSLLALPVLAEDFQYMGSKQCAKCHMSKSVGSQYVQWLQSRHAQAHWRLASDWSKFLAKQRDKYKHIDEPIKAPECLRCHHTGAQNKGAKYAPSYNAEEGVGCEACHGPGSAYMDPLIMSDRKEFLAHGGIVPTIETCTRCHHNPSRFDFKSFYRKIIHPKSKPNSIIFATMAEDREQLSYALVLADSLRTFGGRMNKAPIWLMAPKELPIQNKKMKQRLEELKIQVFNFQTPKESLKFLIARKVFAAAAAEKRAQRETDTLVWLDKDTVFIKEPSAFDLEPWMALAYRPVMHRNIGSLYAEPLDEYWQRIYKLAQISEADIFHMITPADRETIRPYFNAGLLAVNPRRGILTNWAKLFKIIYSDPQIAALCEQHFKRRLFLHQAALSAAILKNVPSDEMRILPDTYNYPLLFERMFESKQAFRDISTVVSIRYDMYFRNPDSNWIKMLKGPEKILAWLSAKMKKLTITVEKEPKQRE
jgi:hypothetical protein